MPDLPMPLLVVLIVLAVIAGLYVGGRAGQREPRKDGRATEGKPLGTRLRQAATDGVVRIWKWNRARTKQQKKTAKNDSREG